MENGPRRFMGEQKIVEDSLVSKTFEIGVASRIMFSKNGKKRAKTRLASTSFGHKKILKSRKKRKKSGKMGEASTIRCCKHAPKHVLPRLALVRKSGKKV